MAGILRVTDGSTVINFIGDTNYKLVYGSWAPKRAKRRRSQMGGQSPYEEVVERIPVLIQDTTTDLIMAKLGVLSDLLDQAEKWSQNDSGVDAVKIVYQPDGSTLADPVEAVIVGGPGQGSVPASYPTASARDSITTATCGTAPLRR